MIDTHTPPFLTEILTATSLGVDMKSNPTNKPVSYWDLWLRYAKSDRFMGIFTSYQQF
jgi:hypothetical protein